MKKLSIPILTMLALSSFVAINVQAQNPHFLRCGASGVNADGTLNVSFTIAGLGSNQSIDVTASATADATYGCLNRGQQCPNAANKVNVQSDVSATGTFTFGKNGSIRASLTVEPPPTTLTCPGAKGWYWFRSVTRTLGCQHRGRAIVTPLPEPLQRTSSRSVPN
jgi:hypothetical protein